MGMQSVSMGQARLGTVHHLDKYVSPCPDPKAWATGAMTCAWPQQEIMYAYPPQFLMAKFLQRLVHLDPTSPSEVAMAGFLTHLFDERKISVGAIRNYRSAITYQWLQSTTGRSRYERLVQ